MPQHASKEREISVAVTFGETPKRELRFKGYLESRSWFFPPRQQLRITELREL